MPVLQPAQPEAKLPKFAGGRSGQFIGGRCKNLTRISACSSVNFRDRLLENPGHQLHNLGFVELKHVSPESAPSTRYTVQKLMGVPFGSGSIWLTQDFKRHRTPVALANTSPSDSANADAKAVCNFSLSLIVHVSYLPLSICRPHSAAELGSTLGPNPNRRSLKQPMALPRSAWPEYV